MTPEEQLKEKILQLEKLLIERHPNMPTLLREIHTTVRKYPEQVTILSPEDIAIIVRSLDSMRNNTLANLAVKSAKSSKKASAELLLNDLLG